MFTFILLLFSTAVAGEEISISEVFNEANSQFSAKMFAEVATRNLGKSMVLSPFSTFPTLAMLSLASVGESHDEIQKVIGIPNDNMTKIFFSPISKNLRSTHIKLEIANRIYVSNNNELNSDFASIAKDVFNSEIKTADFLNKQETADEINTWVEQQTNHRIKNLANPDSFSQDTQAVLVNAFYFKGSWLKKFDKKFTANRKFHVTKEKTIKLPSMFQTGDFSYGLSTELDAKILELPYEEYEASFYIFLPKKIDGITTLVQKLRNSSVIARSIKNMYKTKVDLTIPKFKIENKIDLRSILTKMGVSKLFNSAKARLDNLLKGETNLYISQAIQKAVFEINEEGVEAATANEYAVNTRFLKAMCGNPFTVDRPFYFLLKYKTIDLFSGVFAGDRCGAAKNFSSV